MKYLIKDMPINERPRERLLKQGIKALSNVELLALLLKTGNKGVVLLNYPKEFCIS